MSRENEKYFCMLLCHYLLSNLNLFIIFNQVVKQEKKVYFMHVEVTIEISCPLEDVFAYITNFENNPKWQNGMVSCTFTTPPPLGVGSQYQQVAKFMGREVISLFEVTTFVENKRVEFETIQSTFPIQIVREVKKMDTGTLVHAIIKGQPNGLMKIFSPLVRPIMKRQIEADYQHLKQILENG